ncbi:MAG: CocE/NonD family hydrolase, partial [Pseudomonadota bacterium]
MTLEKPFHIYILIFFLFFVTIEQASAQRLPVPRELGQGEVADAGELFGDVWAGYKVEQHMVPMRDGVRLNTFLLYPEKMETPLPIMYLRSPYGWRWQSFDGTVVGDIKRAAAVHELMVQDQYIFVAQDQRGRFGSEGEYEILRPFYSLTDPSKTDDITDIHDTIDWALETAKEHNGKVGISGTSYRGWNAAVALIRPHPALKASAPSAAMAEGFLGDDFYQNGAFNLAMTTPFLTQSIDGYEASPTLSDRIKSHDEYDFYLKHGTMNALRPYFPDNTPITDRVLKNDRENDYWKQRKLPNAFDTPLTVPTLHVISGYDSEDLPGPFALYHKLESLDQDELNHMVMGPWYHGAWRYEGADRFGPISFGMDTGKYFQEE